LSTSSSKDSVSPESYFAGYVGKPHGLEGFFRVEIFRLQFLTVGQRMLIDGVSTVVTGRKGDDKRPLIKLSGYSTREAVQAVARQSLTVLKEHAPLLDDEEWYEEDLEGCSVVSSVGQLGSVEKVHSYPSCYVLEVVSPDSSQLLIPLIKDAVLSVDIELRKIEVNANFLDL